MNLALQNAVISDAAAEHAISRKQFNRTLSEFGQIQVLKLKFDPEGI